MAEASQPQHPPAVEGEKPEVVKASATSAEEKKEPEKPEVPKNSGKAEGPQAPRPDGPQATELIDYAELEARKKLVEKKEAAVRKKVAQEAAKLQQEARRIHVLQQELARISDGARKDINIIRERIDATTRDLAWYERDLANKKTAYEKALTQTTKKRDEKQALVQHLHTLLADMTVRKEEKLQELEDKLNPKPKNQFKGFSAADAEVDSSVKASTTDTSAEHAPVAVGSAHKKESNENSAAQATHGCASVTEQKPKETPKASPPIALGKNSSVQGLWQSLVNHGQTSPPKPEDTDTPG